MLEVSDDMIRRWPGNNTGVLCHNNPVLDIDITHPEAADKVAEVVRDWFDGRGTLPTRTGMAPKRAVFFATQAPFPKIDACLEDAAGRTHKLEFLGAGQQCVVAGTHPDTLAGPTRGPAIEPRGTWSATISSSSRRRRLAPS